jgi:rRNA maturation protein Nop10
MKAKTQTLRGYMKLASLVLFASAMFLYSAVAFSADSTPVEELEQRISLKKYMLPEEVPGEGEQVTKINPVAYSLSEANQVRIGSFIDDYELTIITKRNSLVYFSKNNEMETGKIFFQVLTVFSKLDSTEVTGGVQADVFDINEPVYTIIKAVANCGENTLTLNSTEYFDAQNKVVPTLSTNIPQSAAKPQEQNIDGQLLKIACEKFEAAKSADPKADKNRRELLINPKGQSVPKAR